MADRDCTAIVSLSFAIRPSVNPNSLWNEREREAEAGAEDEAAAGVSDVIGRQRRAKLGVESNSSRRGRRMSTGGVGSVRERGSLEAFCT